MNTRSERCFVCDKGNRANTHHSPEEVTASVNKLKEKQPKAFLTIEDMSAVENMALDDYENEEVSDDNAQWENDKGGDEDPDIDFMTIEDAAEVKK